MLYFDIQRIPIIRYTYIVTTIKDYDSIRNNGIRIIHNRKINK